MKVCYRCRAAKKESEFNRSPKNRDGLHSYCRECQKQHYRDNEARHKANVRRTSEHRIAILRGIAFETMKGGCVDCGTQDIRVLEFDHVRGTKRDNIGKLIRAGCGVETLRAEIAKCEVRCRNCHAIATLSRMERSWHADYLR